MRFRNSVGSAVIALALTAASCASSRPASPALPARPAFDHSPDPADPRDASAVQLHRDLDAILAAPALQRGYWGVLVKSLNTGNTLYAQNARKLLMPASNMKIVTLA